MPTISDLQRKKTQTDLLLFLLNAQGGCVVIVLGTALLN